MIAAIKENRPSWVVFISATASGLISAIVTLYVAGTATATATKQNQEMANERIAVLESVVNHQNLTIEQMPKDLHSLLAEQAEGIESLRQDVQQLHDNVTRILVQFDDLRGNIQGIKSDLGKCK